jgi:Sigma 54 modulation protein / S30EA ribosomal protein
MAFPLQITFRNMAPSEELEASVRERARELETYSADILGCRVVVALPHHHHERGNRCHVRVELTTPGEPIIVSHVPSRHGALQDIEESAHAKESELDSVHRYAAVAIHESFDAARRRVQDYARRRRGDVKTHHA